MSLPEFGSQEDFPQPDQQKVVAEAAARIIENAQLKNIIPEEHIARLVEQVLEDAEIFIENQQQFREGFSFGSSLLGIEYELFSEISTEEQTTSPKAFLKVDADIPQEKPITKEMRIEDPNKYVLAIWIISTVIDTVYNRLYAIKNQQSNADQDLRFLSEITPDNPFLSLMMSWTQNSLPTGPKTTIDEIVQNIMQSSDFFTSLIEDPTKEKELREYSNIIRNMLVNLLTTGNTQFVIRERVRDEDDQEFIVDCGLVHFGLTRDPNRLEVKGYHLSEGMTHLLKASCDYLSIPHGLAQSIEWLFESMVGEK